jgi:hypothetical protein
MPWFNDPPFSISEAENRGQDVYEVLVSDWGVSGGHPVTHPENMQWPPPDQQSVPISLAGIAIGPQSTVDRAWVSYNLQKTRTTPFPINFPVPVNRMRRLSVDSPLMFTQGSQPSANLGEVDNPLPALNVGALYVFPETAYGLQLIPPPITFGFPVPNETTVLPLGYIDVNGVAQDFGNEQGKVMNPLLHLYLYLRAPIIYAPVKRAPLQVKGTVVMSHVGTERVIAQIPTFGRRSIHIMMISTTVSSFRVGALRGVSQETGMQEQPVDSALNIAANTPVILSSCAQSDHYADYTNLYATVAAGGTEEVSFQLTAYD